MTKRVLIVTDDFELYSKLSSLIGGEVDTEYANTYQDAYIEIVTFKPQLVILDPVISHAPTEPGASPRVLEINKKDCRSGLMLLEMIKNGEFGARPKVVLFLPSEEPAGGQPLFFSLADRTLKPVVSLADRTLALPFDGEQLLATIRELIPAPRKRGSAKRSRDL